MLFSFSSQQLESCLLLVFLVVTSNVEQGERTNRWENTSGSTAVKKHNKRQESEKGNE